MKNQMRFIHRKTYKLYHINHNKLMVYKLWHRGVYIDYERRAQPSKTPPGLQASAFTESNAESLSSVINDHCYIIVKETDTCKHVNITKNKNIKHVQHRKLSLFLLK